MLNKVERSDNMSLEGKAEGKTLVGSINKVDTLTISAYGIAVKNGFEGTEEEWLASLKGDKGEKGADGTVAFEDLTEAQVESLRGEKGADGKDGVSGKDGANGKDGVSATHSWSGTVLTVTSASGTSSANLKGEKGDKGDKGDKGATGATGAQGIQGAKGDTGAKGDKGDKGDPGDSAWTESKEYPNCFYRVSGGVTEWLNPPMVSGVEYRTAERYKDAAVYKKVDANGDVLWRKDGDSQWHLLSSAGYIAPATVE